MTAHRGEQGAAETTNVEGAPVPRHPSGAAIPFGAAIAGTGSGVTPQACGSVECRSAGAPGTVAFPATLFFCQWQATTGAMPPKVTGAHQPAPAAWSDPGCHASAPNTSWPAPAKLTGYDLSGSTNGGSIFPPDGGKETGKDRCVAGWFTASTLQTTIDTSGAPGFGSFVVQFMG